MGWLVDDWKQSWKWWSVRMAAIGTIVSGIAVAFPEVAMSAWTMLPSDLQNSLEEYKKFVAFSIFGSMLLVRLLNQPKLNKPKDEKEADK